MDKIAGKNRAPLENVFRPRKDKPHDESLLLSQLIFDSSSSLQRQITDGVRELIRSERLQPDARIPSIQALAHLWGTNHFTVQSGLKPLVEEGLLERRARIGTRVRKPPETKCFGMYLGHQIFTDQGRFFYMALYVHLHTVLAEAGYQLRIWIDSRDPKTHTEPHPDLKAAIDRREIRGLIAPGILEQELLWLNKLPVPVVGFAPHEYDPRFTSTVHFDEEGLLRSFLEILAAEGCGTVGMISPVPTMHQAFIKLVRECGMKTRSEWIPSSDILENRNFGDKAMRQIWSCSEKPSAIIVFPDTSVQGVVEAIWKLGIRVPEELRLCLHRNEGIDIVCPFPAHWAETSLSALAKTFFEVLLAKNEGKSCNLPVTMPFLIVE